jgi:hypothetical protein
LFERVVAGADAQRILAARDALGADGFSLLSAARNGAPEAFDADAVDAETAAVLRAAGMLPRT